MLIVFVCYLFYQKEVLNLSDVIYMDSRGLDIVYKYWPETMKKITWTNACVYNGHEVYTLL